MSIYDDNTGEVRNAVRADWARIAADAFAEEAFDGATYTSGLRRAPVDSIAKTDCPDIIADLICDLLHLARQSGLDPLDLHRRGGANFEDEEAIEAQSRNEKD